MPDWGWMLVGGLAGAAGVLAIAVPSKVRALQQRGLELQHQIETGGGPTAAQAQVMQVRLRNFAIAQASSKARAEADRFLFAAYGLNQTRMQRIDALTRSLQPLVGR